MGRGLKVIGFSNVSSFRDRHGKIRYRYRAKGAKTAYLAGIPGSPEFAESYAASVAGRAVQVGASRLQAGSISALAALAYQSAEWAALRPTTKANYKGVVERLRADYGDLPVAGLKTGHILSMRDLLKDRPGAANNLIKVLRWLMAFAVSRGWRSDNPAAGVKPITYATDGYHTWSETEVSAFEARWGVGTRERLAFDLLLYTAQRSADVRPMGRQHIADGFIRVKQEKTGAELEIPIHSRLAASLAHVPAGQMLFFQTQYGAPFTSKGFYNWFKAACVDAGLSHCSPHGIRKTAATRLADLGCSEAQIMSVTGHSTAKEVQRYTAMRDKRRLATDAMARIGTTEEQILATPANRLAK